MADRADEGRGYAAISSGEPLTGRSGDLRMGQPPTVMGRTHQCGRQVGELKHLSTPKKRNNSRSSGERTGNSPNLFARDSVRRCARGVVRQPSSDSTELAQLQNFLVRRMRLERPAVEGDSPLSESMKTVWWLDLSTAGHEEPGGKLGRPLPKAKYPADR